MKNNKIAGIDIIAIEVWKILPIDDEFFTIFFGSIWHSLSWRNNAEWMKKSIDCRYLQKRRPAEYEELQIDVFILDDL